MPPLPPPPPGPNASGSPLGGAASTAPQPAPPAAPQGRPRRLVAFDFDHTIADANSDTFILRALPGGLPHEVKASLAPGQWTAYMQRVMDHMRGAGVGPDGLHAAMQELPLLPGMGPLLEALHARRGEGWLLPGV
jgi:hypothetical protein